MDDSLGQFLTMVACLLLPVGWLAAVAWGIRTSQREAQIIHQQITAGTYLNWNKPPIARQLRLLVVLQLGSLIGFVLALGFLFLFHTSLFILWVSSAAAAVFGISVVLIGMMLYRKVLKGKW